VKAQETTFQALIQDEKQLKVPLYQRTYSWQEPQLRLNRADLGDFVRRYSPSDRQERTETDRFRAFGYVELVARDKASLDNFWLRDESLKDTDNLPPPEVIAAEIVEDLQTALDRFAAVASSLNGPDASL